jgi:hypothetical protein
MMTHHQNSNDISRNAEQKVIWEALKIRAPNIGLANRKTLGIHGRPITIRNSV